MSKFEDVLARIGRKHPILGKAFFLIAILGFTVGVVTNLETVGRWFEKPFQLEVLNPNDFNWELQKMSLFNSTVHFEYEIPKNWLKLEKNRYTSTYTPPQKELFGFSVQVSTLGKTYLGVRQHYYESAVWLVIPEGSDAHLSRNPAYISEDEWSKTIEVQYEKAHFALSCGFHGERFSRKFKEMCSHIIGSIRITQERDD